MFLRVFNRYFSPLIFLIAFIHLLAVSEVLAGDIELELNSADGSTKLEVMDSASAVIAEIDSNGNMQIDGIFSIHGTSLGLNNDADSDSILSQAASAGSAGADLYWGDDLLCDVSETNCGWAASSGNATTLDEAYNGGNTIDVDGSAVTLTVSDTDNNEALAIVQNDTTNNPDAISITNTGTGDSLFINQDGNGASINIDTEASTANTIFIDGTTLTSGALLSATVDDTFSANSALFNIAGSALNSDVRVMQLSLTDGGGADVDAIYIDRDTSDARIFYDDANEKWQIDQGDGSGLMDIVAGGGATNTLDGAYNGGNTIDVDGSAVTLTVSDTDNNEALAIVQNDATNNPDAMSIANSGTGDELRIVSTTAGTDGVNLTLHHNSASPADADTIGTVQFDGEDDGSNQTTYASIHALANDVTGGTEDGELILSTMEAGTLTEVLRINELGYIGIGSTDPQVPLHIISDNATALKVISSNGAFTPSISLHRNDINTALMDFSVVNNTNAKIALGSSATNLQFDTADVRFEEDSTINFGGVNNLTTAKLIFNHIDNNQGELTFQVKSSGTFIDILHLDTDGSIGIGDASPDSPLEVLSTTDPQLRLTHTDTVDDATFGVDADGDLTITASGGDIDFSDERVDMGSGTLEIPNGTAPTVDSAGEIAVDTSADDLIYFGGAKRNITYKLFKSFTLESPSDDDNLLLFKAPYAFTITDVECICDPADTGESVVIDIQERNSTGDSPATIDATITCDNDGASDDGALSNGTIDSGDWVSVDIGTVTGTVSQLSVTITFTKDAE